MANFYLIDQSLEKLGGHHFDYVRCVAEACQVRGFRNVIGTHQRFQQSEGLRKFGEIRNVFQKSTYLADSYLSGLRHLTRSGDRFIELEADEPSAWRHPWSAVQLRRHRRRRKSLVQNFAKGCEEFFQSVSGSPQDHVFFTTVNEMELLGLATFLSQHPETIDLNWHLQFHFNLFDGRTPEYESQHQVARIVQRCFDSALAMVPFHKIHFYTTSDALAEQYNRLGVGQFEVLAYPVRPDFFHASTVPPAGRSSDTCDRAEVRRSAPAPREERTLRLTCPGEFRREKSNADCLQNLVNQVWDRYLVNGRICLALQRPVRRWPAKEKIELQPPAGQSPGDRGWVEYYSHPLDESSYVELISNTDCGLLVYDSRAYYGRRAGVLGELLSNGKPVIVPAGCWLADQIQDSVFSHVRRLVAQRDVATVEWSQCESDARNVPLPGGVLSFDQSRHPFLFGFSREQISLPRFNGFAVEFDWHWPQVRGVYCRIEVEFLDAVGKTVGSSIQVIGHSSRAIKPSVIFQCFEPFESVRVKLNNAFHDSNASVRNLEVKCFELEQPVASGGVGVIAADQAEVPRAVDEIVRHYDHYRDTAEVHSRDWRTRHEPGQTIDHIVSGAAPLSRAA
ncbi:MAG: hypothetical protein MK108_12460 [Mariniblastus sp.]|nr:hypothetical protein [Mariniblastus sp.]